MSTLETVFIFLCVTTPAEMLKNGFRSGKKMSFFSKLSKKWNKPFIDDVSVVFRVSNCRSISAKPTGLKKGHPRLSEN